MLCPFLSSFSLSLSLSLYLFLFIYLFIYLFVLRLQWIWCVAQKQAHTSCPACGVGLVTGIWLDNVNYCSCDIGGMSFWFREKEHYVGSSPATPGKSCMDIHTRDDKLVRLVRSSFSGCGAFLFCFSLIIFSPSQWQVLDQTRWCQHAVPCLL